MSRPVPSLITLTYVIYGLHMFSAFTGIMTSAFVVTAFLTGWPSIIAIILNYLKRSDVRGTFLESHFTWQIRTFWWGIFWLLLCGLIALTVIGIPVALILVICVGFWIVYRLLRGFLRLLSENPMPV